MKRNRIPIEKDFGVGSSLSNRRINTLSNVYHRPQEGSGILSVVERKSYPTDALQSRLLKERSVTAENPNVNQDKAFVDKQGNNFEVTRDFVFAYNHDYRRNNSAMALARAADVYKDSLDRFNICFACDNPIKVQKASVERPLLPYNQKTKRQTIRKPKGTMRYDASLATKLYNSSTDVKTDTYADIQPHFISYQLPNGKRGFTLRAGVEFADGFAMAHLTIKRVKMQGSKESAYVGFEYYLGEIHLEGYTPLPYRVTDLKCECIRSCKECMEVTSLHAKKQNHHIDCSKRGEK